MAATGITVLKRNVPWGPFTRAQIEDGLVHGDFTLKYLACAPGLKEWLPLGEVLDYVERAESGAAPSVSAIVELPPVPSSLPKPEPPAREISAVPNPVRPAPAARPVVQPAPPPPLPAAADKPAPKPEPLPPPKPDPRIEAQLVPASFFARSIAFLIDCATLFVLVVVVFLVGALAIEIPGWWRHIDHESRMEEWSLLDRNVRHLALLAATGLGWLYSAGLECSASQATIGKRWAGIKVTSFHGERIGFLRASARFWAKYLSALPCFLGFIVALFSSRGLALHDRLTETRVVKN